MLDRRESTGIGPLAQDSGQDALAGQAPLRLITRSIRADASGQPSASVGGARLVITGETPVADQLAGRLRELGADVETSTIDGLAADHARSADGLIMLDGLTDEPASLPPVLFRPIKQFLASENAPVTGQRWLLAAGSTMTLGLAGLFRAIACEYPGRYVRYVELDRVEPADRAADRLIGELLVGSGEPVVRYSEDARYRLEPAPAELTVTATRGGAADGTATRGAGPALTQATGLTGDSVIVLIGGARGITAAFARELAAACHCRLELIGRTLANGEPVPASVAAAPDAAAVRAILAGDGMRAPAEIERATRAILARREIEATVTELRELGAQVRYHSADVCDAAAMQQILKLVHGEHGRIDALVYGAGVIEDRLIPDKAPESFERVFHTKVSGAQATLAAMEDLRCEPRFVVLFGSVAATFGSRGQADYAAANDALEGLGAQWAARTGHRCLTVHWGPWAPVGAHPGMVTPELAREYARRGIGMIDPSRGAQTLLRELAWGDPALSSVIYTAVVPSA